LTPVTAYAISKAPVRTAGNQRVVICTSGCIVHTPAIVQPHAHRRRHGGIGIDPSTFILALLVLLFLGGLSPPRRQKFFYARCARHNYPPFANLSRRTCSRFTFAIFNSSHSLRINCYQFTNPRWIDGLADRVRSRGLNFESEIRQTRVQ
jgi:hypothetical protein